MCFMFVMSDDAMFSRCFQSVFREPFPERRGNLLGPKSSY